MAAKIPFQFAAPLPAKNYDLKYAMPGFETYGVARVRRQGLAKVLAKGNSADRRIGRRLRKCRKRRRCDLSICPVCLRRFRRWLVGEIISLMGGRPAIAVTLIPNGVRSAPGNLGQVSLVAMKDTLRKQLGRNGLEDAIVVGGIDISFNEHADGTWTPHWQPHFHLVAIGCSREEIKAALQSLYPADHIGLRPIKTREVTDPLEAFSYLVGPYFSRRVSYIDKTGANNTRSVSLKSRQLRDVSTVVGQRDITARLFLRNVRRHGGRLIATDKAAARG